MTTTESSEPRTRAVARRLGVRALTGVAIATAAALILLLLVSATGEVLQVQVGTRAPQQVAAGAIVSVILACGVGAWGSAALATRWAPRPRSAFLTVAVLVLLLSLVPPVTAASGAATWWLEAMHLVVFTALVAAIAPTIPTRPLSAAGPVPAQVKGDPA